MSDWSSLSTPELAASAALGCPVASNAARAPWMLTETVSDAALVFDYLLRAGPVRCGNALRLMRSLGLAIP